MLASSAEVSTVELAALGRRSAPRVAVTTKESAKLSGRSTTWTEPEPETSTVAVSKPSEVTRTRDAMTPASNRPSLSDTTVLVRPSRDVASIEAPGITAPEMSMIDPTVVVGAGC